MNKYEVSLWITTPLGPDFRGKVSTKLDNFPPWNYELDHIFSIQFNVYVFLNKDNVKAYRYSESFNEISVGNHRLFFKLLKKDHDWMTEGF